MNDKETFDASDIAWHNVGQRNEEMNNVQITHFVIYEDIIPPQGFHKLNPFAWINYWRKKQNNLIAYWNSNDEEDT